MPATKNRIECPVCGTEVKENPKLKAEHKGQTYYFCTAGDMKEFQRRPQVYTWTEQKGSSRKAHRAA